MSLNTIYDGIRDYIEERLKDYLPDDTPMFKAIYRSSSLDILGLKIYPSLMMEYGRVEVTRQTTAADNYNMPITFYCISNGGDAEKLQALSENYVWALKRLFENDKSVGGLVRFADIQAYEFSPALVRQQSFVHVGIIDIVFDCLINRKEE